MVVEAVVAAVVAVVVVIKVNFVVVDEVDVAVVVQS